MLSGTYRHLKTDLYFTLRSSLRPESPTPALAPATAPTTAPAKPLDQGLRGALDYYVTTAPSAENAFALFAGEWSSKVPVYATGGGELFDDAQPEALRGG